MLQRIRGHHVWPAPLGHGSVVIDAGAHRGEFGTEIQRTFGARCHLIEANPVLAAGLQLPGATVLAAALSAHDGPKYFETRENPEAGGLVSANSGVKDQHSSIDGFCLSTLMERWQLTEVDLLKLDIEGEEFDLIDTSSPETLQRVKQITVEFHDFLPQYARRGLFEKARDKLTSLGFLCCVMSFRTHGDVLFINQDTLELTFPQSLYAAHLAKYVQKAREKLNRS